MILKYNNKVWTALRFVVLILIVFSIVSPAIAQNPVQIKFDETMVNYEWEEYDEAMAAFDELLAQYPTSDLVDDIEYMLGQCYVRTERYDDAIYAFYKTAYTYPWSNRADDALMTLAGVLYRENYIPQALDTYEQLVEKYPQSKHAAYAQTCIGWLYGGMNDSQKAKAELEKVNTNYPNSSYADVANQSIAHIDSEQRITNNQTSITENNLQINVSSSNKNPVVNFDVSTVSGGSFEAPVWVKFYPSGTYDPDGYIVLFEIDMNGDGIYDVVESTLTGGSYEFTSPGNYTAFVRVTDDKGGVTTKSQSVTISDPSSSKYVEQSKIFEPVIESKPENIELDKKLDSIIEEYKYQDKPQAKVIKEQYIEPDYQEDGLIAYYPFNNDTKDHSGNGNHGTNNGATFVSGVSGKALKFDGNDFVKVVGNVYSDDMSLELWINPSVINNGWRGFAGSQGACGPNCRPFDLWIMPNKSGLHWWISKSNNSQVHAGGIDNFFTETDIWYHIVFVKDGKKLTIYKNGNAINLPSSPFTDIYKPNTFHIGAIDNYFKGIIDEVKIYNYPLNADEVKISSENEITISKFEDVIKEEKPEEFVEESRISKGIITNASIIQPTADSYVYAYEYRNWNKANFGQSEFLSVGWHSTGGEQRSYLKIDLPDINIETFDKAVLKLYHHSTIGKNINTISVHQVLENWEEGSGTYHSGQSEYIDSTGAITWDVQPVFKDRSIVKFKPKKNRKKNKFIEIDITPLVKDWILGTPNNGIVLKSEGYLSGRLPTSIYKFYSKECEDIEKVPVIEIQIK